ncbi:MAG TPA: GGDEF domain-containing protein [Thermotogota bacterium]|nr:GGDEF domain-containing protein [Thermotogota bacterium]HPJ88236.1 GGDEF domain-containing protein [Thermotogota bacterium]
MDYRKKAAERIIESRRCFYENLSMSEALKKAEEAVDFLKAEEVPPRLIEWLILLNLLKTGTCPETLLQQLPPQQAYDGINLFCLIKQKKYKEAYAYSKGHRQIAPDSFKPHAESFRHYFNSYMHALLLFKMEEYENSFSILSTMLKQIDEEKAGELLIILLSYTYSLIGSYYEKRGMMTLSEAMMHKSFQLVEKTRLYFLTARIYVTLAEFYVINYPDRKGINILERISQITAYFPDQNLIMEIEKQWAYFFIYSGDTESFWKRIRAIQKSAKKTGNRLSLSYSYYLEAIYHMYNKDREAAEKHIQRALNTSRDIETEGRCERLWAVIPLIFSDYAEARRRFENFDYKHAGFGFENLLNFGMINDKEELEFYFNAFFKSNNTLWIEEALVGFMDKFTRFIPDIFHKLVKQSLAEQQISDMKLLVALLNEVLGRSCLMLENYEEARFHLGKALMLYKQTGFLNAAKFINNIMPANETDLLGLRDSIEGFIADNGDSEIISKFTSCRYICESNIKKIKVMDEIMEFSRCIDLNYDLPNTLKQILYWISSFTKARRSLIILTENHNITEYYEINFERIRDDRELIVFVESEDLTFFSPLKVKKTYVIDEKRSIIVYLINENSTEFLDEEFFRIFLNEIEPILSLFIKNTLYMQQSIYDSLTNLYSRWYYEDRFREEFEKAIRYSTPLAYVICDIDSFKKVNDTYGHQTGDEVLKEISRIILDNIRKFDIAARFGGEEFSIILPNTNLAGAEKVAEKIRIEVEKIRLFPFSITMSFGVNSIENREYDDFKQLEKQADIALYKAKKAGKNKVVCFDDKNNYDELSINFDF